MVSGIPERVSDSGRTTVSLQWDVYSRLADLRREVARAEKRELSLSDTVQWALDRIDAADLP